MQLQLSSDEMTIEKGGEKYLKYIKITNRTPKTIKYYEGCLRSFSSYLQYKKEISNDEREPTNVLCSDVNEDMILDYIEYLQDIRKISDITVNSYLRGLRALFYWFAKKGYCKKIMFQLIKQDEPMKETFTNEELDRLLKKPKITKENFVEYRTWVMTSFFLATGSRISAVLNLKLENIDLKEDDIYLYNTKKRKYQIIPITTKLHNILSEYISIRGQQETDYLFCNQFGYQLRLRSAEDCIKDYNLARGVTKSSAHLYRHTFAKIWVLNDRDLFTLQKMLGHTTLDMVKKYVQLFGPDLKIKNNQFNPLDMFVTNNEKIQLNL